MATLQDLYGEFIIVAISFGDNSTQETWGVLLINKERSDPWF